MARDPICERFEAEWKAGSKPSLRDYLEQAGDASIADVFRDLLQLDIAFRRAAGEELPLEDYIAQFPEYRLLVNDLFETQVGGSRTAQETGRQGDFTGMLPPRKPTEQLGGYRLLREIGRGGMGVVYEALDLRNGTRVALKTLSPERPRSLQEFKKEFRALAGITHRNLVVLGALVVSEDQPFFTMELIEGRNFLEYVRFGFDSGPGVGRDRAPASDRVPSPEQAAGFSHVDETRLLNALRQIAEGVQALHDAGKLHRDIKATNILVTRDDRVVILDFGLAVDLDEGEYRTHVIAGTPAYMAPEQRTGGPITVASDWYSVGAMLYEALHGSRLSQKTSAADSEVESRAPLSPDPASSRILQELHALCHDLLQEAPADRPSGLEILNRLSGSQVEAGPGAVWIGRDQEIQELARAAEVVRQGQPLVVLLHGPSGIGKTAVANRVLADLNRRERVIIFRGRCIETESVPYNAFDGIVDALCRFLGHLPAEQVQALLPLNLSDLCRVFPAFSEIPAVVAARESSGEDLDLQELRHRAFAALRELLLRLVRFERALLIFFIDDLQWGDLDSAELFLDLTRLPGAPALLLLATYRSEDEAQSECLRAIRKADEPEGHRREFVEQWELPLGSLPPDDAQALAVALLSPQTPEAMSRAQAIAGESAGSPLFVQILSQSLGLPSPAVLGGRGAGGEGRLSQGEGSLPPNRHSLSEVLWRGICGLPQDQQRIIEVIAAAGRPISREVVRRVAGLTQSDISSYGQLRNRRFIRAASGARGEELIEAYHDRVRETVLAHLPESQLKSRMAAIAELLEQDGRTDPEWLADLHFRAGHERKSGEYFAQAADNAYATLAFEKAARLYRRSLDLAPASPQEDAKLRERLADALSNSGRSAEAAVELLRAAAATSQAEVAVDLRCRAAMRYLTSGHIDDGLVQLAGVLKVVGIRTYRHRWMAIASLLWQRCKLWFRPFKHTPQKIEDIPPKQRMLLDVCWSAAAGLSVIDPIRAADYVTRNVLLAMDAGDQRSMVRALAAQSCHMAIAGMRSARTVKRYLRYTRQVAAAYGHPYGRASLEMARGTSAHLQGRWRAAQRSSDRAVGYLADLKCRDVAWELDTARTFAMWSLMYMGDVAELTRRQPNLLRIARENNDLFAMLNFGTIVMVHVHLGADQVEEARRLLEEDRSRLSHQGFFVQHHNWLLAKTFVELYAGDAVTAWLTIADGWRGYAASMLGMVQQVRIDFLQTQGRAAVAAAAAGGQKEEHVRSARSIIRKLQGERALWADGLASALQAGLENVLGNTAAAANLLDQAAGRLFAADMRLFAAAARRQLGVLKGSSELVSDADSLMRQLGIANPRRMAAALVPGFLTSTAFHNKESCGC
jgi:serine/threonine protein kinase